MCGMEENRKIPCGDAGETWVDLDVQSDYPTTSAQLTGIRKYNGADVLMSFSYMPIDQCA